MVYVVVVHVVVVVGTFDSESTAAAAVFYSAVVVDVALPACCRPPGLNLQPICFCLCVFYRSSHREMGISIMPFVYALLRLLPFAFVLLLPLLFTACVRFPTSGYRRCCCCCLSCSCRRCCCPARENTIWWRSSLLLLLLLLLFFLLLYPRAPIAPGADFVVYADVVRVVAVLGSFESVSATAAAAAVVYVVVVGVVVAVPACCRLSAQNTRLKYIPGTNFEICFAHYIYKKQLSIYIFFLRAHTETRL